MSHLSSIKLLDVVSTCSIPDIGCFYMGKCMINILKVILGAGTGLSGVGAFIFYAIYKQLFSVEVLSSMTPEQVYNLTKLSAISTFIFALMLVILHQLSKGKDSVSADNGGIAVKSSGKNNNIHIGK